MSPIHISIPSEVLTTLWGIPITNAMLTSALVSIALAVVLIIAGVRAGKKRVPGPIMNAIEALVEAVYSFVDSIVQDVQVSTRIFPLIMTFFMFILLNNWVSILPGISAVTLSHHGEVAPILRSGTSDLNTTIALALITVVITQIYGIRELGIMSHLGKYISLNPIQLFVGLLELTSEMTRLISFSFRLFGSVFAGEVLLIVIGSFIPLAAPLPFLVLEVLFGLIQAVVFSMLTLIFIKLAVTEHHAPSPSG